MGKRRNRGKSNASKEAPASNSQTTGENPSTVVTTDPATGDTITTTTYTTEAAPDAPEGTTTTTKEEPISTAPRQSTIRTQDTVPSSLPTTEEPDVQLSSEDEDESIGSPAGHGDWTPMMEQSTAPAPITPAPMNPDNILLVGNSKPPPEEAGAGEPASSLTQSIKQKAKQALGSIRGKNTDEPIAETTTTTTTVAPAPFDPGNQIEEEPAFQTPEEKVEPPKESRNPIKRYFQSTKASSAKAKSPMEIPSKRDSGRYFLEPENPQDQALADSAAATSLADAPPNAGGNTMETTNYPPSAPHRLQRSVRPSGPPQAPRRPMRQTSASYFHPTPGHAARKHNQTPGTDISTPATVRSFNRRQESRAGAQHVSFPTTTTVTTSAANPNPTVTTTAGRGQPTRQQSSATTPKATATSGAYGRAVKPVTGPHPGTVISSNTTFDKPIAPEGQEDQPALQPGKSPVQGVYGKYYADDEDDVVTEQNPGVVDLVEGTEGASLEPIASSVYTHQQTPLEDGLPTPTAEDFLSPQEFGLAADGATAALAEADRDHGGYRAVGNVGGLRVLDEDREARRAGARGRRANRTSEWVERRSFSYGPSEYEDVPELVEGESGSSYESEILPFPRGSHQYHGAQNAHYKPGVTLPPLLTKSQEVTAASAAAAALYGHRPVEVFRLDTDYYHSHFPNGPPALKTTLDTSHTHKPVRLSTQEWNNSQNAASAVLQLGKYEPTDAEKAEREEARQKDNALEESRAIARNGNIMRAANIAHRNGVTDEFLDEQAREDNHGLTGARLAAANAPRAGVMDTRSAAVRAALANHNALMETARERAKMRLDSIDRGIEERELYGTKKTANLSTQEMAMLAAQRRAKQREAEGVPEGCVSIGGGGYVQKARLEEIARQRLGPTLEGIHNDAEERRGRELAARLDKEEAKRRRDVSRERRKDLERELKAAKQRDKAHRRLLKSHPSTTSNTPTRAFTAPTPATRTSNTAIHQPSEPASRMATQTQSNVVPVSSDGGPISSEESNTGSTTMIDALRLGACPTPPRRSLGHGLRRFFMYRYHEEEPLICTPPAAYKKPGAAGSEAAAAGPSSTPVPSAITASEQQIDHLGDALPTTSPTHLPVLEHRMSNTPIPSTASVHSAPLVSVETQQRLQGMEGLKQSSTAPGLSTSTSAGAAAALSPGENEAESREEGDQDSPMRPDSVSEAPARGSIESYEIAVTEGSTEGSRPQTREDSGKFVRPKMGIEEPAEEGVTPRIRKFTDSYADALRRGKREEDKGDVVGAKEEEGVLAGEGERKVVLNSG